MTSPGERTLLVPEPLREPATILARPSALAATRAAWVVLVAFVAVLMPPHIAQWAPWLLAPLVVAVVLDAGALGACAWSFAALVITACLPPGGVDVPAHVVATLLALAAVRRGRGLSDASALAPLVLGGVAVLVHDLALVVIDAATTGRVAVALVPLVVRTVAGAVLTQVVAVPWNRWADRERARGRA